MTHGDGVPSIDVWPAEPTGPGGRKVGLTPGRPPMPPTRLDMLARLLWLCFYSVAMVAGGNAMLVLPQIREGLWAFDDGDGDSLRRQAIFVVAFLYWAVTTWYVARLTLGRRFPNDSVGSSSPFVHSVAQWLPRLLALAACLPLALFLLGTGKHGLLAGVLIVVSLLFIVFTWGRRRLIDSPDGSRYYRYFDQLRPSSYITLMIGFAVPHLVLLAILVAPISTARLIGAPALILLAMGTWSLVGGMVLSYWPRTRGWSTLSWLPVALLLIFSGINDNHPVNWHAGPRAAAQAAAAPDDSRPSLKDHYEHWMQHHPAGEPVYLVASAGGASRASYWAGVVLGRLEDEARADHRRFGSNIFMMSGISGGSVGIAAYAAALRAWPAPAPGSPAPATGCLRLAMDQMLGADVLSPVGALMLYPDLMQRFLPAVASSQRFDRSRGLEEAWAWDWQNLMEQPPPGCAKPSKAMYDVWSRPFAQAVTSGASAPALPAGRDQPALVLNTARLEDGRRVLQSNVLFDLRDADDLFGAGFEVRARAMTLAGAAHNSARFPLVSPPGTVQTDSGHIWGHLGDGGYHEVTGAATLADVIEELIELGCMRRDPPRQNAQQPARLLARPQCGSGVSGPPPPAAPMDTGRSASAAPISGVSVPTSMPDARVVIVLLDNTPTGYPTEWQRDLDGASRVWPRGDRAEILHSRPNLQPIEIAGPIVGLLSHSSQEARSAEQRLVALAGTDPFSVIELRLPRYRGLREPSMNWQLDHDSRREMMCAADPPDRPASPVLSVGRDDPSCSGDEDGHLPRRAGQPANLADDALQRNLQRIRTWIHQLNRSSTPPRPASTPALPGATR